MPSALIQLTDDANRILNMVKAKFELHDKSEAVELVIKHYVEAEGEPSFTDEFVARVKKAEQGKFIRVDDIRKHYA